MTWAQALAAIPRCPWLVHGRDPKVGMDCVGLVFAAYRLMGLPLDDLDEPYGKRDAIRRAARLAIRLQERLVCVGLGETADGDVLVMRLGGTPSHLGIVVGPDVHEMRSSCGRSRRFLGAVMSDVQMVLRYRGNHGT